MHAHTQISKDSTKVTEARKRLMKSVDFQQEKQEQKMGRRKPV